MIPDVIPVSEIPEQPSDLEWIPQQPSKWGCVFRGKVFIWRRVTFTDGTSRLVLATSYLTRPNGILAFDIAVDPETGNPLHLEFGAAAWRSVELHVAKDAE